LQARLQVGLATGVDHTQFRQGLINLGAFALQVGNLDVVALNDLGVKQK